MEFHFTHQDFPLILRQIVETSLPQLQTMSKVQLAHKPTPQKWSKQEILGHLVDSAYNNHQRFLRATTQNNLVFQGYDQVRWVQFNAYQKRNSSEIIQLWTLSNLHLAMLIGQIPENILWRDTTDHNFHLIGMNPIQEGHPSSLAYFVWDYIYHLEHHLGQILPEYEKISTIF